MVKRISERNHVPYRQLDVNLLGAISPLKPELKDDEEMPPKNTTDDEGFTKVTPRKLRKGNYVEQKEIFRRIQAFLDGFSPLPSRQNIDL